MFWFPLLIFSLNLISDHVHRICTFVGFLLLILLLSLRLCLSWLFILSYRTIYLITTSAILNYRNLFYFLYQYWYQFSIALLSFRPLHYHLFDNPLQVFHIYKLSSNIYQIYTWALFLIDKCLYEPERFHWSLSIVIFKFIILEAFLCLPYSFFYFHSICVCRYLWIGFPST